MPVFFVLHQRQEKRKRGVNASFFLRRETMKKRQKERTGNRAPACRVVIVHQSDVVSMKKQKKERTETSVSHKPMAVRTSPS